MFDSVTKSFPNEKDNCKGTDPSSTSVLSKSITEAKSSVVSDDKNFPESGKPGQRLAGREVRKTLKSEPLPPKNKQLSSRKDFGKADKFNDIKKECSKDPLKTNVTNVVLKKVQRSKANEAKSSFHTKKSDTNKAKLLRKEFGRYKHIDVSADPLSSSSSSDLTKKLKCEEILESKLSPIKSKSLINRNWFGNQDEKFRDISKKDCSEDEQQTKAKKIIVKQSQRSIVIESRSSHLTRKSKTSKEDTHKNKVSKSKSTTIREDQKLPQKEVRKALNTKPLPAKSKIQSDKEVTKDINIENSMKQDCSETKCVNVTLKKRQGRKVSEKEKSALVEQSDKPAKAAQKSHSGIESQDSTTEGGHPKLGVKVKRFVSAVQEDVLAANRIGQNHAQNTMRKDVMKASTPCQRKSLTVEDKFGEKVNFESTMKLQSSEKKLQMKHTEYISKKCKRSKVLEPKKSIAVGLPTKSKTQLVTDSVVNESNGKCKELFESDIKVVAVALGVQKDVPSLSNEITGKSRQKVDKTEMIIDSSKEKKEKHKQKSIYNRREEIPKETREINKIKGENHVLISGDRDDIQKKNISEKIFVDEKISNCLVRKNLKSEGKFTPEGNSESVSKIEPLLVKKSSPHSKLKNFAINHKDQSASKISPPNPIAVDTPSLQPKSVEKPDIDTTAPDKLVLETKCEPKSLQPKENHKSLLDIVSQITSPKASEASKKVTKCVTLDLLEERTRTLQIITQNLYRTPKTADFNNKNRLGVQRSQAPGYNSLPPGLPTPNDLGLTGSSQKGASLVSVTGSKISHAIPNKKSSPKTKVPCISVSSEVKFKRDVVTNTKKVQSAVMPLPEEVRKEQSPKIKQVERTEENGDRSTAAVNHNQLNKEVLPHHPFGVWTSVEVQNSSSLTAKRPWHSGEKEPSKKAKYNIGKGSRNEWDRARRPSPIRERPEDKGASNGFNSMWTKVDSSPKSPMKRFREVGQSRQPVKKARLSPRDRNARDDDDRARRPSPVRERHDKRHDPYREERSPLRRDDRYNRWGDRREKRPHSFHDRKGHDYNRRGMDRDIWERRDDHQKSRDRCGRAQNRGNRILEERNTVQYPSDSKNGGSTRKFSVPVDAEPDMIEINLCGSQEKAGISYREDGDKAEPSNVVRTSGYYGRPISPIPQRGGWPLHRGIGRRSEFPNLANQLTQLSMFLAPPTLPASKPPTHHPPVPPLQPSQCHTATHNGPHLSAPSVPQPNSGPSRWYEVVFESKPYGFGISPDTNGRNGIIGKVGGNQTKGVRIGSRILSINGQPVDNWLHTEILNVLKNATFPVRITFSSEGKLPSLVKVSATKKEVKLQVSNEFTSSNQSKNASNTMNKTDHYTNTPILPGFRTTDSVELHEPMAESPVTNSSPPISPDLSDKNKPPITNPNPESNKKIPIDEIKSSKQKQDEDDTYISSPSLSALSDDTPSPAKKRKTKKSKRRAKKKRTSESEEKVNIKARQIILRFVKHALKDHRLAREDFKVIAKKCSNKLFSNFKRNAGRKRDPKVWASKRKPKIKALVAKYVKLQQDG